MNDRLIKFNKYKISYIIEFIDKLRIDRIDHEFKFFFFIHLFIVAPYVGVLTLVLLSAGNTPDVIQYILQCLFTIVFLVIAFLPYWIDIKLRTHELEHEFFYSLDRINKIQNEIASARDDQTERVEFLNREKYYLETEKNSIKHLSNMEQQFDADVVVPKGQLNVNSRSDNIAFHQSIDGIKESRQSKIRDLQLQIDDIEQQIRKLQYDMREIFSELKSIRERILEELLSRPYTIFWINPSKGKLWIVLFFTVVPLFHYFFYVFAFVMMNELSGDFRQNINYTAVYVFDELLRGAIIHVLDHFDLRFSGIKFAYIFDKTFYLSLMFKLYITIVFFSVVKRTAKFTYIFAKLKMIDGDAK